MSDDRSPRSGDEGRETRGDQPARHEEVIQAEGHEHVAGAHASTFEVTTDDYLTPTGDCIVGIEADRAPADFDDAFVAACREPDARIVTTLSVRGEGAGDARGRGRAERQGAAEGQGEPELRGEDADGGTVIEQRVVGSGHPELSFENDRSAVWRTSEYVDDRTVAVAADHAAADLDRNLVDALARGATLTVHLAVEVPA